MPTMARGRAVFPAGDFSGSHSWNFQESFEPISMRLKIKQAKLIS